MGRWGRGQENQMKLFHGSGSTGLQLSSTFVICSMGGRARTGLTEATFFHKKKLISGRKTDLGWIRLPSLTPNGIETQVRLYFPSLAKEKKRKKEIK